MRHFKVILRAYAAVVAGVVALSGPAAANTALPAAPSATAPSPDDASVARVQAVVAAATRLRQDGIANIALAGAAFGAESTPALDRFVPPASSPAWVRVWRYFFESAVIEVGGGLGERPVIGFYNPLVDSWVLARLRWNGAALVLTEMTAMPGEILRRRAGPLRAATAPSPILANYVRSAAAFAKLFPPTSRGDDGLFRRADSIADQAAVAVRTIHAHEFGRAAAGRTRLAQFVRTYLDAAVSGDPVALQALFPARTTSPPEWIAQLSPQLRQSLQPAAVFRSGGNLEVALTSPAAGRLLVLLDVSAAAHGPLRAIDVTTVDYASLPQASE